MKTAILSDIHGNATALEAVLKDVDSCAVNMVLSLGDNIGYGPEPEKVIDILRSRKIPSVTGNHELGVTRPDFLPLFNPIARKSIEMTIDMLSENCIHHIENFPNAIVKDDLRFVHGFPPESPTKYLFELSDNEIENSLSVMVERYCFIGHTHDLEILILENDRLTRHPLEKGIFPLNPKNKYLINSGSVGQPRDGNSQAKYVIWDSITHELTVKYITYNIFDTVKKIYNAGLPDQHALRLL
ncbi:MAG: metallophosphoesterase [Desulfobacteraceae bacterium]|nr:metallophosphoesterase family protein [Desulfobacteraceae bacterium]MBC2756487.1 metallophosphoesterase [Desulfobacteraceae bacterium]